VSRQDYIATAFVLLLITLAVALGLHDFTNRSTATSIVQTRTETMVFDHGDCRVYELTISDSTGPRRVSIATPHQRLNRPPSSFPSCRVTK